MEIPNSDLELLISKLTEKIELKGEDRRMALSGLQFIRNNFYQEFESILSLYGKGFENLKNEEFKQLYEICKKMYLWFIRIYIKDYKHDEEKKETSNFYPALFWNMFFLCKIKIECKKAENDSYEEGIEYRKLAGAAYRLYEKMLDSDTRLCLLASSLVWCIESYIKGAQDSKYIKKFKKIAYDFCMELDALESSPHEHVKELIRTYVGESESALKIRLRKRTKIVISNTLETCNYYLEKWKT